MSNRTLIEINHDYGHEIERHPERFMAFLEDLIRGGSQADLNERFRVLFGIRVFGTRHHSDAFAIDWGGNKAAEPSTHKS